MTILAAHVCSTLPDSIERRLKVLNALENIIGQRHPMRSIIREALSNLQRADRDQLLLSAEFEKLEKGDGK